MSAPFCNKSVANECRRVCGCTSFTIPAFVVYFFTMRCTLLAVNLSPRASASLFVPMRSRINKAGSISIRLFKYSIIASLAVSEIKTIRILPPLPRTLNSCLSKFMSSLSIATSSDTRKPVENNNSNNARSRFAALFGPLAASSSRDTSSGSRNSTCRSGIFPTSIFSEASVGISLFAKYLRKLRTAIM